MRFLVQRGVPDGNCTLGQLLIDGVFYCYTLEPQTPIPAGTYSLTIRQSPRFGRLMPHVENVPGHTGILIHWGNWAKDTLDCTLVGETSGPDFIGHSVDQFNLLFIKIQDALEEGPQTISYVDADPTQSTPTPTSPSDGSGTGTGNNGGEGS